MQAYLDAIEADASEEDLASLPLPESYRAVTVHKDEASMFEGMERRNADQHRDDVERRARVQCYHHPKDERGDADEQQHLPCHARKGARRHPSSVITDGHRHAPR